MTKIIKRVLDSFKLRRIAKDSGRGRGVSRIKQKEIRSKIQTYKKKDFTILDHETRHVDADGLVRGFDDTIPNPDTRGKSVTDRQSLYEVRSVEKRLGLKPGTISLSAHGSTVRIQQHGGKEAVINQARQEGIASVGYRHGEEASRARAIEQLDLAGVPVHDRPITRNKGHEYSSDGLDGATPLHIGSREFEGESDDV